MRRNEQKAKRSLLQLLRDRKGLAYLEFALILPCLMLLFMGGLEVTRYIQTSQRVDKVTHTIVDLIAQAPEISTTELDQIMLAVQHIISDDDFAQDGTMIVSCVGFNNQGQLIVKWQYTGGGALPRTSRIGEEDGEATLPEGFVMDQRDNIIVAETFYYFEPMVNETFVDTIEFYRTAFYLPRLGELDTLQD